MLSGWPVPLAIMVGALVFFSIGLSRSPHPDELHHVLAARSLSETGVPAIADGLYRRGLGYTWLVARSFEVFGVGIAAARIPSILSMAALTALLFVWLRSHAGAGAAWLGSLLFATSPFTIEVAQFSRFYAPQALAFFIAAGLFHAAVAGPLRSARAWLLGLTALPWIAVAAYFQVTTFFGLVGIAAWFLLAVMLPAAREHRVSASWLVASGVVLTLSAAVVAWLAWQAGALDWAWSEYRNVPSFGADTQNDVGFYFRRYLLFFPIPWLATPVLAIAAFRTWPKPTTFVSVVFAVSFVFASFGGYKGMRYIAFAQPFLFALWGMGLAAMAAQRVRLRRWLQARLSGAGVGPDRAQRLAGPIVVAAVAAALVVNPFWLRSATLMADVTLPGERPTTHWMLARPALETWLAEADVVVSTEELGTLYFLGRYDVRFSPSKLGELEPDQQRDFGIDHRTGRPVIASPGSLELVMGCYASGLVVGPIDGWGKERFIDRDVIAVIEREAQRIEVPEEANVFAFGWRRSAPLQPAPACDKVRSALSTAN